MESGIWSLQVECGANTYAKALIEMRKQQRSNALFLNQDIEFQWLVGFPPSRLEDLVLAIAYEHPEIVRVKQVGHTNEPDAGRDLVADVTKAFLGRTAMQLRETSRIVVQCKASNRNVGKSSVVDVRDTVDQHQADGFLLVAVPGITRPLFDYIESVRRQDLFWIDVWSKPELEALLRADIEIAKRFPDVISFSGIGDA